MAVTFVSGNFKFLNKVGISNETIETLKQSSLKIDLGFYDFRIKNEMGKVLAACKLPHSTNELMKGTVSPSGVAECKTAIFGVIKMAISAQEPVLVSAEKVLEEAEKVIKGNKPTVKVEVTTPGYPTLQATTAEIKSASAVPLAQASKLYQPVKGTSSGSRYFVVAMNDDIRVAARVENHKVSIRVEGNLTPEIVKKFQSVNLIAQGSYMSAHFEVGKVPPSRLIGAVLLGSGVRFLSPMPDLKLLEGSK